MGRFESSPCPGPYELIASLPVAKSSTGRCCLHTASAPPSDQLTGFTGAARRQVTVLSASQRTLETDSSSDGLSAQADL